MVRIFFKKLSSEKFSKVLDRYKINRSFFAINRRQIKKGVLIGVFFALFPIPIQIFAVIMLTFFFRFNIIVALSIVLLTNPITMPFIMAAEYRLGMWILHKEMPSGRIEFTMQWVQQHLASIVLPLYTGAFSAMIFFSILAYFIVEYLWIYSVKKAYRQRREKQ
jgi:uncharacterized protein